MPFAGAGNDTLIGNDVANVLDGGAGTDIMRGLAGNDTYFVDGNDQVLEIADGGYDYVVARTSYALAAGASVELMSTDNNAGTAAINLTGNELTNVLVGNAGANVLNGGSGGADLLQGLGGNDTYFVDGDDRVLEDAGGGFDYVVARSSYVLTAGASVELLSTNNNAGTAAIDLTGNELGQVLVGNAGANVLNGGSGGADLLQGLGGNDTYFVDGDDRVLEDAGGGFDYVVARANHVLAAGASVELMSTDNNAGTASVNLTGNELARFWSAMPGPMCSTAGSATICCRVWVARTRSRSPPRSAAATSIRSTTSSPAPTRSRSTMRCSPPSAPRARSIPMPSSPGQPPTTPTTASSTIRPPGRSTTTPTATAPAPWSSLQR